MTGRLMDSPRWTQSDDGTYERVFDESSASPLEPGSQVDKPEEAGNVDAASDYADMTKVELQAELEARGLPTSGNKDELIERLEEPVEA